VAGEAQITVADDGVMRAEYSTSARCHNPGDADTHVCLSSSGSGGGELSGGVAAGSGNALPHLDTTVSPESLDLPAGAHLPDYFVVTVSANAQTGWQPYVFADGFE